MKPLIVQFPPVTTSTPSAYVPMWEVTFHTHTKQQLMLQTCIHFILMRHKSKILLT